MNWKSGLRRNPIKAVPQSYQVWPRRMCDCDGWPMADFHKRDVLHHTF